MGAIYLWKEQPFQKIYSPSCRKTRHTIAHFVIQKIDTNNSLRYKFINFFFNRY